jgi:hypothetical protein
MYLLITLHAKMSVIQQINAQHLHLHVNALLVQRSYIAKQITVIRLAPQKSLPLCMKILVKKFSPFNKHDLFDSTLTIEKISKNLYALAFK